MSSILFTPISLGTLRLSNRIVVPPMCQYSAENGVASDWHAMHYGALAASGAGLVVVEATAVSPEGRISPQDLGLWSDETEAALKRMLDGIRTYSDTPVGIQLAHAGRKASTDQPWRGGTPLASDAGGWLPEAPSALAFAPDHATPHALDVEEIGRLVAQFRDAARRAGFEVNLLADYARSSGLTGLVVGFGGVSDAELDAALAALVAGLRS